MIAATSIVLATLFVILPFLWLIYMVAYNKGRSEGTLAERARWTSAFQGKGHPGKKVPD